MTVRRLDARDCLQSCGLTSKGLSLCLFELNLTGCETSRLEIERWKILHSAKDLGVSIARNVEIQTDKTLVHKLLAVLTRFS